MRWPDERWVKVYTRDTGEWLALGWEAQALFLFALRKADRAGILKTGKMRSRGLAGMTGMPLEVVERSIPLLLEDGCMRETDGGYVIPNFLAAQEAQTSASQRKRDQRERDRAQAIANGMPAATSGMVISSMASMSRQTVTLDGHAMSSREEVTQSQPHVTPDSHAGTVTPRVDESRVDESSSSTKGTASPSPGGFELTSPASKKQRQPSAAERLFDTLQATRKQRCDEVGEAFVEEHWPHARRNRDLKPVLEAEEGARARFEAAWGIYLADDGQRARRPAWSLAFFMSSGVRADYETRAAREEAA